MLKALQARELGLGQINSVVSNVTKGLVKQGTQEAGARLTQQWASVLDKFRTAEPTPASA